MKKLGAVALLGSFFAASVALTGCGEDGQGIREAGKCPAQPLYHYEFADGGGRWVARHPSQIPPAPGTNTDLTPAEQAALDQAITGATSPGGGVRCLTPPGNAKTLDAGN
jgi:hypothetical protein